jgi:hypothetical protein
MPDVTLIAGIGAAVLVGGVLVGVLLRRVLGSVYGSRTDRPENIPDANGANDRTPPGS